MFCNKCGSQLADDAAFCSGCGAMQGAAASKSSILSFLPASWQSILNKVLKWIQADKRRVLIILAVLIVLIIFVSSLGGGLSGTYELGDDYETKLTFRGSSVTYYELHFAYDGKYRKVKDGYQLEIAFPMGSDGALQNVVFRAVENGKNLIVTQEGIGRKMVFKKK